MKWIVITSPDFLPGEASAICFLLQNGVDIVHLRKPYSQLNDYRALLKEIPSDYHGSIVLHDHFELCGEFGIQGVHINTRNRMVPSDFRGFRSCSCHSLEEVCERKEIMDYVFLSPIFDSISKPGYKSAFSEATLREAWQKGIIDKRVMALGGITFSVIPWLQSLSFGGAAFLGDVWEKMLKEGFVHLKKYVEEGSRMMDKLKSE